MSATQIQKVNHRHHAIIDWLLAHPREKNLQVLCDSLNLSRSWLSIVMNSHAFQEEFERRRGGMDEELQKDLIRTNMEMSIQANIKMKEYLQEPTEKIDPRVMLDASNATVDRYYGPKTGGGGNGEGSPAVVIIDGGILAQSRERMRGMKSVTQEATETLPAPEDKEPNVSWSGATDAELCESKPSNDVIDREGT